MNAQPLTQHAYPGDLGAPPSSFTLDAPSDWARVWQQGTVGVLDASGAAGIPESPFRPNLMIEAARVTPEVRLEDLLRQILDGNLVEFPGLEILDEVVTRLGDRVAVRRTQRLFLPDPELTVRQTLIASLAPLADVPELEFFQLTASFEEVDTDAVQGSFDEVLASFQFTNGASA